MRLCSFIACAIAIVPSAAGVLAGPLNPPAGAVVSSGKTLTDVEPRTVINSANTPGDAGNEFIITQPGSYVLAGNVSTAKGQAIHVVAPNVTIDLRGFEVATTHATGFGVLAESDGLTVVNGRVTASRGIISNLNGGRITAERLEVKVGVSGIGSNGAVTVHRCVLTTTGTGSTALSGKAGSHFADCTIIAPPTTDSTARVVFLESGVVENCVITGGYTGVHVYGSTVVRGCQITGQSGRGVDTTGGVVERNSITVTGNAGAIGVKVNSSCEVRDNTIFGAGGTAQAGISVSGGQTLVTRNSVRNFGGSGSAGVLVTTAAAGANGGNKIQDNELTNNFLQISVQSGYNLIVRNTMSFSGAGGAFTAVASNAFGPVINCNNSDLGVVAGSGHPQANLVY